jgi:hypothetical protein
MCCRLPLLWRSLGGDRLLLQMQLGCALKAPWMESKVPGSVSEEVEAYYVVSM